MTSKPRHLHPAALVFFFYQSFKEGILPFIISVIGTTNTKSKDIVVGIGVIFVLFIIVTTLLNYWMFTYQILSDEIVTKSGIFVKKINHVPYDRIQNVMTNQWFFLKPFGLEELKIETASQTEQAEVELKAVPNKLRQEIENLRSDQWNNEQVKEIKQNENTYSITWKDLIKFSLTSSTFLSGLLLIMAMYGKIQRFIDKQIYQTAANEFSHLGSMLLLLIILLILLILYLISALVLISQYYHFTLVEKDGHFEITRGLFQVKRTDISINRIQAIIIKKSFIRTLLGIATIKLVVISNTKENSSDKDVIIMPVIKSGQLKKFMEQFFPDIPFKNGVAVKPRKLTYYYYLRNVTIPVIVIAGVILWLFHLTWVSGILIIIESACWYVPAYLVSRCSKSELIDERFLVLQNSYLMTKQTIYVPKRNIQYIRRKDSIWLNKRKIASLIVNIRSGVGERRFRISYQPQFEINNIVEWYKK